MQNILMSNIRNSTYLALGESLVYNDIAPSITDTAPSGGVWRGS